MLDIIIITIIIFIIMTCFIIYYYHHLKQNNSEYHNYEWLKLITFPYHHKMSSFNTSSLSLNGGSLDDVLEEVRNGKLREDTDEYKNQIIQNIINGIEGYKKIKNLNIKDEDIIFVGQGYQNVVVRIGKNSPLLRIAKYIRPFMFRQFHRVFNILRKFNGKSGFLTPSFFRFEEGEKQYIIWEIKELKQINNYNYDKILECVKSALTFLNHPDVDLSYIDFKYENIMEDPSNGKYIIADFDIYKAFDVRNKFKDQENIKAISINDLQEYNGRVINYCSDQEFVGIKVLLTYFDNVNGIVNFDSLDSKYNPKLMSPSLFARAFMLKVKQDMSMSDSGSTDSLESNSTKYNELITITDYVINEMINMKSTNPNDVLSFNE